MAETGDGTWVVERGSVGSGLEVRLQRAVGVGGVESKEDGTGTGRGIERPPARDTRRDKGKGKRGG